MTQERVEKNMSDSMSGRAAFLNLLPFSTSELRGANLLPETPYPLIFKGTYPPLHDPEKKFIPYDGRYNTKMETFINKEFQRDFIINLKLSNFLKRAKEIDLGSDKNIKAANIMMGVKNI